MANRKRNSPSEPEVPLGIVAVFFVIALMVAFAKFSSGSSRSFAQASGTERTTASGVASLHSQYTTQSPSISLVNHDGNGKYDGFFHECLSVCRSRANVINSSLT